MRGEAEEILLDRGEFEWFWQREIPLRERTRNGTEVSLQKPADSSE